MKKWGGQQCQPSCLKDIRHKTFLKNNNICIVVLNFETFNLVV